VVILDFLGGVFLSPFAFWKRCHLTSYSDSSLPEPSGIFLFGESFPSSRKRKDKFSNKGSSIWYSFALLFLRGYSYRYFLEKTKGK